MNRKMKACPLLPQSDTSPSYTVPGESHMRTYFIPCLGEKCAAYINGYCVRFDNGAVMKEEDDNEKV